jgi:hypothetical protein
MLNNGDRKVNPEKKNLIILFAVFIIFIMYFVYDLLSGLYHTCKGSLIFLIFLILIALTVYWRMGERRKQSIIYLYYFYLLFGLCFAATMIHNNCFGG